MSLWETDNIDYHALGFRCGVEIHQQLDTDRKLFCRCPVGLVSGPPDAFILRHMRPTLSEMGEYDGTALMEKKTRKEIIYQILNNSVCTYEMDDTPPFLVNEEAFDIGIKLALLFQCKIVDEAHVARKQYLDGSIPTGFQRTILIGTDGWVPYKGRRIGIRQINVEEDACREVSDEGHRIVFRTDRLSTPLVEVITEPHMPNPTEAGEVMQLLSETNRISGLVRRGIGTARQDVNVSITGGNRVEIKGVEKIGLIPALTHYEALRQKALLELRDELVRRRISIQNFSSQVAEVTPILAKASEFVGRWATNNGGIVSGISIKGFNGILGSNIFPERTFGDEIAGRVRVIACLDKLPNIAYDSNHSALGIPNDEWSNISRTLSSGVNDDVVITWGPKHDVETALLEIAERCREAILGVPKETRQVMRNGRYTDFERILPGPDRMYPDTDHPPIRVDEARIQKAMAEIPEFLWERRERLKKMGLSEQLVDELATHPFFKNFQVVAEVSGDPKWAARTIAETLKFLKRKGYDISQLEDEDFVELAKLLRERRFYREGTAEIIKVMCQNGYTAKNAVEKRISKIPFEEIDLLVAELIKNNDASLDLDKRRRFLMGLVMRKYRGAIPGEFLWHKISQAMFL
jgi:glutamyl-tRNA(Gln) amidotransferase subunit E